MSSCSVNPHGAMSPNRTGSNPSLYPGIERPTRPAPVPPGYSGSRYSQSSGHNPQAPYQQPQAVASDTYDVATSGLLCQSAFSTE